jgi:hypothetical protein
MCRPRRRLRLRLNGRGCKRTRGSLLDRSAPTVGLPRLPGDLPVPLKAPPSAPAYRKAVGWRVRRELSYAFS